MLASLLLAVAMTGAQAPEVISEIVVHGNMIATEQEIVRLAGVTEGMPLEPQTIDAVRARLHATGRFERVEVLRRFASIADPSLIVLVIVVDEGRVSLDFDYDGEGDGPRVTRRRGPPLMYLPILAAEDGYGLSYGVRVSWPQLFGAGSRFSVPLTWGADKRAAVEFEQRLAEGPLTRVGAGASASRRRNPFFREDDNRRRVWVRGERALSDAWRVGGTVAWETSELLGETERFVQSGVDVVVDTRLDPFLARNAVYGRAAWDRLAIRGSPSRQRLHLEARGYLGVGGQSVIVLQAARWGSNGSLPAALQPTLGGMDLVRGFRAGSDIGDTLVTGSAEVRLPLTSPLNLGRVGVSAFFDLGAAYDENERVTDQRFSRGAGGSVWLSAAVLRVNIAVARGLGGATRVHLATGVTF